MQLVIGSGHLRIVIHRIAAPACRRTRRSSGHRELRSRMRPWRGAAQLPSVGRHHDRSRTQSMEFPGNREISGRQLNADSARDFGYLVNDSFRDADEGRAQALRKAETVQRELDLSKSVAATRQAAVGSLSRYIYERRVRAEMLLSGLRRHAKSPSDESRKEVMERKRLYDDAYVSWNANHQANLLLIRQVLGSSTYSEFEGLLEFRLVSQVFSPLDKCLTEAYDLAIRKQDPRSLLESARPLNWCSAHWIVVTRSPTNFSGCRPQREMRTNRSVSSTQDVLRSDAQPLCVQPDAQTAALCLLFARRLTQALALRHYHQRSQG